MYGLSFIAALFASVAVCAFSNAPRRTRVLSVLLLSVILALPLVIQPHERAREKSLRVALLGTDVQAGTNVGTDEARALLDQTLTTNPDLIVMPEAITLDELYGAESGVTAHELLEGHPRTMLAYTMYQNHFQTLIYETEQGVAGTYKKMFLMPLGEYAPSFSDIFYKGIKDESLKAHILSMRFYYQRGTETSVTQHNDATLGGLLCSEVLSPHLYEDMAATKGADILLNLSNNSWFHHSPILHAKLLQVAKTHAVANHTYFLVAANASPAYAVDPNGRVIGMTNWKTTEALFVDIPY